MKKLTKPPTIDLTPMVDLGFLLLVTFMTIHFYSKPRLLELNMPDYGCYFYDDGNCVMREVIARTLFLDKDSVYCQRGQVLFPGEKIKSVLYADLRTYILAQETKMESDKKQGLYGPRQGIVYLIKPLSSSRYENLVDVLDEMTICNVGTYAIVEVTLGEQTSVSAINSL